MSSTQALPPLILNCCQEGGEVEAVRINPEGSIVASSTTNENAIKLWDATTGQLIRALVGHTGPVRVLVFSSDGAWLASGSNDHTIKLWDVAAGQELRTFEGHQHPVLVLDISIDGQHLISADDVGRVSTINLWDVATGMLLSSKAFPHSNGYPVTGLLFKPSGDQIVLLSRSTPKLWTVTTTGLESKSTLPYYCHTMCWDSTGDRLVGDGDDGSLEIIDCGTSRSIWRAKDDHPSSISYVQFCANSNLIISASHCEDCGLVNVWDAQLGVLVKTLKCPSSLKSIHVCTTTGNRFVCLSSDNRKVQIWNLGQGMVLPIPLLNDNPATCMDVSADALRLAWGTTNGTIHIFDKSTGADTMTICWPFPNGDTGSATPAHIMAVHLSGNGKRLAASANDGRLAVWDVEIDASHLIRSFEARSCEKAAMPICISHSGDRLVCGNHDGLVMVWSIGTGRALLTLEGHKSRVTALAISHDEERVTSSSIDYRVLIWDTRTGGCLQSFDLPDRSIVTALLLPIKGNRLWIGQESGVLSIWERDKCEVRQLDSDIGLITSLSRGNSEQHEEYVLSCHAPADGARQTAIHVWDERTCVEFKSMALGSGGTVLAAKMTSDGNSITYGMSNGRIGSLHCPEGFFTADSLVKILSQSRDTKAVFEYLKSSTKLAFQRDIKGYNVLHALMLKDRNVLYGPSLLQALEDNPMLALASQEFPHERRTLLSLAVDSHNVNLVRAVLTAINVLITEPNYLIKSPAGLPYYDASDLQKALSVYPKETIEAMGKLWDLARVSIEPLRRKWGDRAMKGARTLTWVWEGASGQEGEDEDAWWWWPSWCSRLYNKKTPIMPLKLPSPGFFPAVGPVTAAGTNRLPSQRVWGAGKERASSPSNCATSPQQKTELRNRTNDSMARICINEAGIPMLDWVLPVPGMCEMGPDSFIATCVHVAKQLNDTAIFEKPAIQTLLDYKWDSYARAYFLILWATSLALALSFSLYTYYSDYIGARQRAVWLAFIFVNLSPLLIQELSQMYVMRPPDTTSGTTRTACLALTGYFSTMWNMVDATAYSGLVVAMALRATQPFGKPCYIISAAVSLLLWLKLLYYFRGFQSTGVLVRAVMQITRDIRFFLAILLVFILGFGNAFYLLTQVDVRHGSTTPDDAMAEAFGSAQETFKSLFSAMTGGYDLNLFATSSLGALPSIMYIIYVVVQAIIMLNLLIAIMGDSYDRVQDKAMGEWRCEQAKIILELEQVLPLVLGKDSKRLSQWQMPWLHVLMEEGKESGAGEDDWAGRVKTVVRGVNAQVKSEMEVMKGLVKSEVASMQIEIAAIRAESAVTRSDLAELRSLIRSVAEAVGSIQSKLDSSSNTPTSASTSTSSSGGPEPVGASLTSKLIGAVSSEDRGYVI